MNTQDEQHRAELARRLERAVSGLSDYPVVVIDEAVFEENAADLVRRAAGTPIRVASKSVRVPDLLRRVLARDGFHGVLGYQLAEALWLVEQGISGDVVVAYPTVDREAIGRLLDDERALAAITLMVDDAAHLDVVDAVRSGRTGPPVEVRVALDVDAGLRVGPAHVGPKRSPLTGAEPARRLARAVAERPGFRLVGVMTYEGQVAGVPDEVPGQGPRSAVVRRLKQRTLPQLSERRASVVAALREVADLEFFNGGGTGSVETTVADRVVTEVAAGSGLFTPATFDHFRSFQARPAAYFAVPVVRRPSVRVATVAGGGFIASGAIGRDRLPLPWAPPGLELTALEGAGEVQTPLVGPGASGLRIGDLVWFRHAKAGELMEHTNQVHLVDLGEAPRVVDTASTYRGLGHAW